MQHAPSCDIWLSLFVCTIERHINNIIYSYSNDNFFDFFDDDTRFSEVLFAMRFYEFVSFFLISCFLIFFLCIFSCRFSQFGSITFGNLRKKAKTKRLPRRQVLCKGQQQKPQSNCKTKKTKETIAKITKNKCELINNNFHKFFKEFFHASFSLFCG